jgi:type II secretion system protein N
MKFFERKIVLLMALFCYGFFCAVVVLYFRFPSEKLQLFCETKLEQLLTNSDCSISGLGYGFPFSVTADTIRFSDRKSKKQELFTIADVRVTPILRALTSRFGVELDAFGGTHNCTLELNRDKKEFTLQDIQLRDLNPSKVPFLQQASKREITGTVTGTGSFHGKLENGKYVTDGKGKLSLERGKFGLLLPVLSLNSVDLRKFETEILFEKSILQCQNGVFHGNELNGKFSGSLELHTGLQRASLSFNGEIEPLPPLLKQSKEIQNMVMQLLKKQKNGTIPFVLQGTVQTPSFKFET